MNTRTFDATFEDGVRKSEQPLPLKKHEKVQLTLSQVDASYGLIQWTGVPEVLRQIAEDDEYGIMESP